MIARNSKIIKPSQIFRMIEVAYVSHNVTYLVCVTVSGETHLIANCILGEA